MKDIELPRKVMVGDGAIERVRDMTCELNLKKNALIIVDKNTEKIAGKFVTDQLDSDTYVIENSCEEEIRKCLDFIKKKKIKYLAGVGGGTIIDFTKICAFKSRIPFLSIPTAASHDGITSPQATLKGDKPISIRVHSPMGIIADTEIIRKAPKNLLAAGCADAISNYTAILDWKLAHREINEYYGDYAASLSMMSAKIVMDNAEKIKEDVSILVEALISSGVAIGIAGSSRPCSGAEHLFSHALDLIVKKPALHGEQCGVGCIMMAYLHRAEWERVKNSLKKVGAPTTANELRINEKHIIRALTMAHTIRDRYTILKDGLTEHEAIELAKATGVIE